MINLFSLMLVLFILIPYSLASTAHGTDMDVKCTVYQHSDDENGDNVDVRTLVMGLKANTTYTAEVKPDHNAPAIVSTKTDFEGIFWIVAKIPNGEKSLFFNVYVYEGKNTHGKLVASGDDDAPCDPIRRLKP